MSALTDAQRIAAIIQDLQCLPLHQGQGGQPEQNITISRSIISFLDQNYLLHRAGTPQEQVLIISKLQDVAYHDAETGGIQDIAQWCTRQWLRLLQQYPASSIVLQSKSLQVRVYANPGRARTLVATALPVLAGPYPNRRGKWGKLR